MLVVLIGVSDWKGAQEASEILVIMSVMWVCLLCGSPANYVLFCNFIESVYIKKKMPCFQEEQNILRG